MGVNAAGDVYVADRADIAGSGGRIQQFSASGQFKRLWGIDVVSSGPGNADETQTVRVQAAGGAFTLTFGGETTAPPIPYNAAPDVVQDRLNDLLSIGGVGGAVTVEGGPGNATGASPYRVRFGGIQGDADQPLIEVVDDALTGPNAGAFVATTIQGATGFEICEPADGDVCKVAGEVGQDGLLGGAVGAAPTSFAVDPASGDSFVRTSLNRINRYSPSGEFLGAFGYDTIFIGPGDSTADEIQRLTVSATAGSYSLNLNLGLGLGSQATSLIPHNAPAADPGTPAVVDSIQEAINALPGLQSRRGSVTVTGSNPYTITFAGTYAGDQVSQLTTGTTNLTGTASVTTLQEGGAPEVCTPSDVCKQGVNTTDSSAASGDAGVIGTTTGAGLAVAPPGAPNAGNVLVPDANALRVTEFTNGGAFVRTFGWDVIAPGGPGNVAVNERQTVTLNNATGGSFALRVGTTPNPLTGQIAFNAPASGGVGPTASVQNALEALPQIGPGNVSVTGPAGGPWQIEYVGSLATIDVTQLTSTSSLTGSSPTISIATTTPGGGFEVCTAMCKRGGTGSETGQFASAPTSVAVDATGAVYTAETGGNRRVQKFTPAGGLNLSPSGIGVDERQSATVKATAGQFRLTAIRFGATTGAANYSPASTTLTNVTTSAGSFRVGQPLLSSSFHPGTLITGIGVGTMTVSQPPRSLCSPGANPSGCSISSNALETTADLPYDVPASGGVGPTASLQNALNALPAVSAGGGSVSVTGGGGDASGSSPYAIAFSGALAGTDFPQIVGSGGTVPLTGGSGVGANQASVVTVSDGGPGGRTDGDAPIAVAADPDGQIYIAKRYPAGASTCADGSSSPAAEVRIQEFPPDGSLLTETSRSCAVDPFSASPSARNIGDVPFDGLRMSPSGEPFLLNAPGSNAIRVYAFGDPGPAPELVLDAVSGLAPTGAVVSGAIDPNGPDTVARPNPSATRYRVEYRKVGDAAWTEFVPGIGVGTGTDPVPFSVGVSGLAPKTDYEVRVSAIKPFGFAPVRVTTETFTTLPARPTIETFSSGNVTAGSADLRASINPQGTETTYRFEYGPTPAYGNSTPEVNIGDSHVSEQVEAHIEGLDPVVYHFRVVATNDEGTTASTNQTFSFYPEPCPNAAVRQQTGSSTLPDCRAYELVSPENAGASQLRAGGPSSPYATSPPRLAFHAFLNAIPGPWNPPNISLDSYTATRSATGWNTAYIGTPATLFPGNPVGKPFDPSGPKLADREMSRFLHWQAEPSYHMAPYLTDAQGDLLGRWPTNLAAVPGADEPVNNGGFIGDLAPSGDFSHYFFSSVNFAFADGGITNGAGSVYDNDIATGDLAVASKLPGGGDIPPEPGFANPGRYLLVPGVSTDGSRVLIAAATNCSPTDPPREPCPLTAAHLYMRVDGALTYDVSQGHAVAYRGMADDGSKVFFTSKEDLTDDGSDNDASTDLYVWSGAEETITRLSAGTGDTGDTDNCSASWIAGCGVEVVATSSAIPGVLSAKPSDNAIAPDGEAIYFYSPEQLVGTDGIPGRRNLYAFREGSLTYVTTLDVAEPLTRIQVFRDHAAFTTATRLTVNDTAGHEQMYLYDADSGALACASCNPTGEPPTGDVQASQNGIFMTEDGRAFFTTADPLVPADTNGLRDIYEYVGAKPQLISTGTAAADRGSRVAIGLFGVSADGVDVYFSTVEPLVAGDRNGSFLRIYDARTNGGFPVAAQIAPCAAADECHGGSSPQAVPARIASTAHLGNTGNAAPKPSAKKRRAKKRRCRGRAKRAAKKGKASRRCRAGKRRTSANRRAGG